MAAQVGYDMESIAVDIKTNLEGQSKQMQRVGERLGGINSDTNIANRQLEEIKKARNINKLILYGVLAGIAVAVIVVVAIKLT